MLREETIRLLRASDLSHNEIARRTGLRQRWVSYVASGRIAKPGMQRTMKLYAFLETHNQREAA
jgi:transcriptional regulator with XRE-family HTH domain